MATPNSTIITKETNGNVSVTAEGGPFTLLPDSYLTKETDGVKVRGKDGSTLDDFKVATVQKVIREDLTEVTINDVDTLYDELNEFFFFKLSISPAVLASIVKTKIITQTLNDGDNTLSHNLGVSIQSFSVKDGVDIIEATGNDIDLNDFNINISGGGPITDADIYLNYL